MIEQARAILRANDRGGYTVPTDRLYPFQWNWDSAFVAMGFATFDVDRALTELERLVEGQWDDGMIPHIIFHAPADSYFPGPDVWRTRHRIATSGITQPPVFGYALAFIARRAGPGHQARIGRLYKAALANLAWWTRARDPEGRGLVAVLHNWETGRDNSPEWDIPLARVPETTVTPVRRRDTGHVDASMRPTDADYRRYTHLVDAYAAVEWDPPRMWAAAPFKVADIGTNAILAASAGALAALAPLHGDAKDEALLARLATADFPWSEQLGGFVSLDLIDDAPIEIATSAGFLPLLSGPVAPARVERLAERVEALLRDGLLPVPSTFPGQPGYEPKRYWRGPVWAVVSWMIARGFARQGRSDIAARLDAALVAAIDHAGPCEYFNPETGQGLGGASFSWTAAIRLLLEDGAGADAAGADVMGA
jgi:glycogen debranching enzyme